MAEGNGVPRWVEERFTSQNERIDRLEAEIKVERDERNKMSDKLQATRENMSNLLGRFAIISALIGAATAALLTLVVKLITGA